MTRYAILISFMVCLLGSGCQWSGDRADEIFWQETLDDLKAPDTEQKLTVSEKQKRMQNNQESVLEDNVLTLPEAFRLGLKNSEALRKQAEKQQQNEARKIEVISTILPTIQAHASRTVDSDQVEFGGIPRKRNDLYGTLDLQVFSGEFLPALNSNKYARKIGRLQIKDLRNQLLFDIASRFYRILQIQEDIRALNTSLARVKEFLNVVEAQREAGTAPRDQLLLARSRRDEIRSSLVQRRHDEKSARSRLATLIDLQKLPEELREGYTVSRTSTDIPTLVNTSFEERADFKISRHTIKKSRADKNRVRSEYLPDLDFRFTHQTDRSGAFNKILDYTMFYELSWTLFDGFGREARMAQAYSQIRQNRLERKELRDQIRGEVKEAVYAYRSLDQSLDAMKRRMDNAREAVKILKNRFEAGEVIQLEVLEAEETAKNAERTYRRSALARKLSAFRIRLATGTLENTDIVGKLLNKDT